VGWEGVEGGDNGGNVANVQYKSNQNCYYKYPRNSEFILMKNNYKKNKPINFEDDDENKKRKVIVLY
jgi:hypothetical protein